MRAGQKDFFREIRKNRGRFVSIVFIVMLGTAFYSGLRSTCNDMRQTADTYYDSANLMDIRVLGTMGLTDTDIESIRQVDGVKEAEGVFLQDALCQVGENSLVIKVISDTGSINQPRILSGRLPEQKTECFADAAMLADTGLKLGDTIRLESGNSDDLEDSLKETGLTIVGTGYLPHYSDKERGTAIIGDGQADAFLLVPRDTFSMEIYTACYLVVEGAEGCISGTDAYKQAIQPVSDRLETLSDKAAVRRIEEVKVESEVKLKDAEEEVKDAEAELADAEEELTNGRAELTDAEEELSEKEKEFADGEAELIDGEQKLNDAQAQINDGIAQLDAGEAELNAKAAELADGRVQYEEGLAGYESGKTEYETSLAEYEAGVTAFEAGEEQYAQALAQLEAAEAMGQDMTEARMGLEAQRQEMDAKKAAMEEGKTKLDTAKAQLDAGKEQLDATGAEIENGEAQIEEARAEIAAKRQELAEGQAELNGRKTEAASARAELEENRQKLTDGRTELEEKKLELADAEAEYQDKLPGALEDIAEAKEKIQDGWDKLADLELPKWYVLDREKLECTEAYDQNAQRMAALSKVFPVIFFLVAALVSLTAMTRMVEEQRMQIGTLKALGYADRTIAGRYLWYAVLATLGGGIPGVIIGELTLPYFIIRSYQIQFTGMNLIRTPINYDQALQAVLAALISTVGATLAASLRELRMRPAQLMRPVAPKGGRRVILERIGFLWKRMNFTQKATIRNLLRYKKRFVMTVIGVGGCKGLLLVGYGMSDSIAEIVRKQYVDVFTYQSKIALDTEASREKKDALLDAVREYDGVSEMELVTDENVTLAAGEKEVSAVLVVPEDSKEIGDFVHLQSRRSHENYAYPESGAVITEQAAKLLGLEVGDSVTVREDSDSIVMQTGIEDEEDEEAEDNSSSEEKTADKPKAEVQIPIVAISENYVSHYLFISRDQYRKLYDLDPEPNTILVRYFVKTAAEEEQFGSAMLKKKACTGFTAVSGLQKDVDEMLGVLGDVMWVLILAAGLLAFVVLYNLNSINITERKRELATLKVLGFFDGEVAMYVFRENMILTLFGVAFGFLFGTVLHYFVVTTVETDLMMFGRRILPTSYLICAGITVGFALLVNLFMDRDLRKIDMIESLKSVE